MKIQVEILDQITNENETYYKADDSKTVFISSEKNETTIQQAKDKLDELKLTLSENQKIRILEYNNDEPDKTRTPCKILMEK